MLCDVIEGHQNSFDHNILLKIAKDAGVVSLCSARRDASYDMRFYPILTFLTFETALPAVISWSWPFGVQINIFRILSTRGTRWCCWFSSSLISSKVTRKQTLCENLSREYVFVSPDTLNSSHLRIFSPLSLLIWCCQLVSSDTDIPSHLMRAARLIWADKLVSTLPDAGRRGRRLPRVLRRCYPCAEGAERQLLSPCAFGTVGTPSQDPRKGGRPPLWIRTCPSPKTWYFVIYLLHIDAGWS